MTSRRHLRSLLLATLAVAALAPSVSGWSLARFTSQATMTNNFGVSVWRYRLHNVAGSPPGSSAAAAVMTMDEKAPTFTGATLPNYGTNCTGGSEGRLLTHNDADCDDAVWQTGPMPATRNVSGTATLHLWIRGGIFYTSLTATLLDYDPANGSSTTLGSVTVTGNANWSAQTDTITIPAGRTVAAGHVVRLRLTPNQFIIWFDTDLGYDGTNFDSYLLLPPQP